MCGMEHVRVPPAANAQNGRVERVHLTNPIVFERYLRIPDLARSFKQKGQATLRPSASYQTTVDEANKADLHLQPFGCQVFYRDHRNPQ